MTPLGPLHQLDPHRFETPEILKLQARPKPSSSG